MGQSNALHSCFSSHTLNKCLFHSLFNDTFPPFFQDHLLVILLMFKMVFKYSAEVLSSVPQQNKVNSDVQPRSRTTVLEGERVHSL